MTMVIAAAIWYLSRTHRDRHRCLYATGFNPDASRLAGVPVDRLRFVSLVTSSASRAPPASCWRRPWARGSPTAGTPYLLPAFAAVFLGATQLKNGAVQRMGVIAVLRPARPAFAAAPQWSQAMFVGVVLIAALAVTGLQRRTAVSARGSGVHGAGVAGTDQPGVASGTPLSEEA